MGLVRLRVRRGAFDLCESRRRATGEHRVRVHAANIGTGGSRSRGNLRATPVMVIKADAGRPCSTRSSRRESLASSVGTTASHARRAPRAQAFSRIWERMFGKKEMRILMVDSCAEIKILRRVRPE